MTEKIIDFDYPQELLDMLMVGNVIYIDYGEKNINTQSRNIRAIVDEEFIVYRILGSENDNNGGYRMSHIRSFYYAFQDGCLSVVSFDG